MQELPPARGSNRRKKRLVGHADLEAVGKSGLCRVTAVSEAACVAPPLRPAPFGDVVMSPEDDTADDQP